MLEEIAARDHPLELLARDEMIVAPVDFVGAGLARRERHREAQLRLALHQRLDQARLARARRRGDHVQTPGSGGACAAHIFLRIHAVLRTMLLRGPGSPWG